MSESIDPVALARRYVELSNEARLDDALAMFADHATYASSQVGAHEGRSALPFSGQSLAPLLAREFRARHGPREWLGFELGGDRALRKGAWKIVWMAPPFGVALGGR